MSEMVLTVSQAARVLDVSANTLRDWHKSGKLVPSVVTPQGWRLYSQADMERLRTANSSKQTGGAA
jgi:DNA-binding transcriptional MerR regulator